MIYVLVPARDEAATVGLLLWKVRQVFTAFNREYQILVVNDGSTDTTDDVLAPYARALPMTLVTHRRPVGYAGSLEELLRLALERTDRPRRDMAVTLQADFSDSPDDIPELVRRIEGGADVVVSSGRVRPGTPRMGRIARRLLPRLVRAAVRVDGAEDCVGTLRAYRLAVIERLVREHGDGRILTRDGWAADLELLVRAGRHARRIESVRPDGAGAGAARPPRRGPLGPALETLRTAMALRNLPPPAQAPVRAEPDNDAPGEGSDGQPRKRKPRGRGRGRGRGRPGPSGRPASTPTAR